MAWTGAQTAARPAFWTTAEAESPEAARRRSLIVRARSGDPEAFDELMKADQARLLRTARHLLGKPEDAEEALQDAFLRIYRFLGSYDPERSWEAWTYRIVVNVCRKRQRRESARRVVSLEAWRERASDDPTGAPSPDAEIEAVSLRQALLRALRRLPLKERAAVTLCDIEGLSGAEAAEVLGVSATTVRSQASRGRSRLREWLGEGGER